MIFPEPKASKKRIQIFISGISIFHEISDDLYLEFLLNPANPAKSQQNQALEVVEGPWRLQVPAGVFSCFSGITTTQKIIFDQYAAPRTLFLVRKTSKIARFRLRIFP
mgnify:CR=1 FL=1